ncbi:MAG: 50S ribosomal protein L24 [Nonlabens ulvanivorans]|uniref:Large ribosomal subunit protein uL24 n=1 Tax=Nonlabens ulvanivorans TaxID=906888 RepID=A0A084JZ37_NONUL|nr:50S ribosomal protein L24 [Nonlabens ulvanivorans]KEZ94221.1 50S ribosomal protein L24 [Nonlabens ulvanivorans]PRX13212.1 LSU ribosomal protein L24P [Nonlabens ulvanivorans]WOI21694.1 50S ribosomal protein L24 [Nonlabens ulvanivorans]GAK76589.1 LSU ribosomal protein L24p [Nonlabens ulvanivorans]GAL00688.1 LSU ribosomal protein L24p [Nonlabens ulvanivorans]
MVKVKIKTGDKVRVLAGEHKGSEGVITRIFKDKNKAIVEGVNMVSKHEKPSATNPQGGIKEIEAPMQISNLSLIDNNGKTTRVGYRMEGDKKVRFAKTTNDLI